MSAIEDVRKVIQDLVAPDLAALNATVKALEISMKDNFQAAEKLAGVRHDLIVAELKTYQAIQEARYKAMHALDVDRRLERLEQRQTPPVQPA